MSIKMNKSGQLTERQIYNYIACPVKYETIYDKQLATDEYDSMPQLLKHVAMAFYTNLMNGRVLTTDELKRKWDKECEAHSDFVTAKKCIAGMGKLIQLWKWASNEQLVICDVKVPIAHIFKGRDGKPIDVRGSIPVIAAKNGKPYILVTDFGDHYPDQTKIDMNLRYTLQSYITLQERGEAMGIRIHNVKNDKDFFTYRMVSDYERLKSTIANVACGIQNKIYYPRESPLCTICSMKEYCRGWHN